MVAAWNPQPTDQPRKLFVCDEHGNEVCAILADPITGGATFGCVGSGNVLARVTPEAEGLCIVTFRDDLPNLVITVDDQGNALVERFGEMGEGN